MTSNPYAWRSDPREEWRTIQIAAARAGCVVRSLEVRQTAFGPRVVGEVDCPDGWGAARMLLAAAIEDARSPGARDLALRLRQEAPSDAEYARAIQRFVKDKVKFVREHGEVFTSPGYTIAAGGGDCDDHARAAIALALAGGIGAQLGILYTDKGEPAHAAPVLCTDGRCMWAETTVDAKYGEHPLAAAMRLGLLKQRGDIAKETRIMTEKDLAPVPPNFVLRNPPAQVALDADALVKLGYLAALPGDPADPTDMTFRAALLALQLAVGITADGLIGPESRRAIAGKLPLDSESALKFQTDYRRSLGDVTGSPTTKLTAHLSDDFFAGTAALAKALQAKGAGVRGLDFLAVWLGESGVHSSAGIKTMVINGKTVTIERGGLNGMGVKEWTAAGFNGTYEDWIALSPADQLVYVARFYLQDAAGREKLVTDAPALELLNFLPAFLGHASDPTFILARKGEANGWYAANPGLDNPGLKSKKGYIEVADMQRWIAWNVGQNPAYWAELASRMAAAGDAPPPGVGIGSVATLLVLLAAGGAAAADMLGKL